MFFLVFNLLIAVGFGGWNLYLAVRRPRGMTHYLAERVRSFDTLYVLVPALNEAATINATVSRLLKIADQVADEFNMHILVIDDASTDGTVQQIAKLGRSAHLSVLQRHQPNAQTGKGHALNEGLDWLCSHHVIGKKTLIGVIDSDSTPDATFFRHAVWAFNHSHYGLVQTSVAINNVHSYLGLMQDFEFNVANKLIQTLRMDWGSALASGNGQFMTYRMAHSIRWSGGLLDDLEFSLRGLLKGYYGGFLPSTPVPQQATHVYPALLRQRTRWCQGGMQCLFRYGRAIARSPKVSGQLKLDIWAFMLLPFVGLFILPTSMMALGTFSWLIGSDAWFQLRLLVVVMGGNLVLNWMLLRAAHVTTTGQSSLRMLWMLCGILFYIWLLAPVPYFALYRVIVGANSWSKTTHTTSITPESGSNS